MSYGTKVITNGNPNESDVRWGMILKASAMLAGIAATVCGTLFVAGMLKLFQMASKQDVIEARQLMVLSTLDRTYTEIKEIRADIAAEDYLTRTEFARWATSSARVDSIRSMARDGNATDEQLQREIDRLKGGSK